MGSINNLGYVNSPCKNCTERYIGCHSECNKYKKFKDESNQLHDKVSEWKHKNNDITDYKKSVFKRVCK